MQSVNNTEMKPPALVQNVLKLIKCVIQFNRRNSILRIEHSSQMIYSESIFPIPSLHPLFTHVTSLQDVEIKKMSGNATYGFVLFYDLMSAIHAKQYMDGENVHGNHIRVRALY